MYICRKRQVTLANYLNILSSSDIIKQLHVDLPRMQCIVNDIRVRSIKEFHVALHVHGASRSRLAENALSCILMPFATQIVMAEPVLWLQSLFINVPVLDGRSPLSVNVKLDHSGWILSARKMMLVHNYGTVLIHVHASSKNPHVCITLQNVDNEL